MVCFIEVYFGSYDRYVYALFPDGTEKWRYELGGPIVVPPTIDSDGTMYIGTWDNHLYAIDDLASYIIDGTDLNASDNQDQNENTPGFEIIIMIAAVAIMIFLKKKKIC